MSILCFSIYFSTCLPDRLFKQRLKSKIVLFLLEIRIWMVICTMDFSLTSDTRREKLKKHQSGPSGLIIYPGYQKFHPTNVSTSRDESPARSESPPGSSGSGSEHVNKRWETTEVKILISAYKDHHENLNNSKSSKGKKYEWEKICDTFTEHCTAAGIGSSRSLAQRRSVRVLSNYG